MNKTKIYQEFDLNLINFDEIFKSIQISILNDLNEYKLINQNAYKYAINLRNVDTRKIIKHHIILEICNTIKSLKKKYRHVIFIQPNVLIESQEICNYIDCKLLIPFVLSVLHKINVHLPIFVYHSKYFINFNDKNDLNFVYQDGVMKELFADMKSKYDSHLLKHKNFNGIKIYAKENGLTFLNEYYFNEINNKFINN